MEMLIKAQENVSIWAPGCVYTAAASLLYSKNHQLSNFCRITNSLSVDATTRTPSSVGGFCLDRLKALIYQITQKHTIRGFRRDRETQHQVGFIHYIHYVAGFQRKKL